VKSLQEENEKMLTSAENAERAFLDRLTAIRLIILIKGNS